MSAEDLAPTAPPGDAQVADLRASLGEHDPANVFRLNQNVAPDG
jgi:hypothetical protein